MRTEIREILQSKLEDFVSEYLNEKAKGSEGISIPNAELKYYKGFLDGMCCALNCKSWQLESGYWVVRDAHNRIIATCKDSWEED